MSLSTFVHPYPPVAPNLSIHPLSLEGWTDGQMDRNQRAER